MLVKVLEYWFQQKKKQNKIIGRNGIKNIKKPVFKAKIKNKLYQIYKMIQKLNLNQWEQQPQMTNYK